MAISVSNLITGQSTSADPTTADITPTSGAHILVWVGASEATTVTDDLTVAGGSATWTKISTGQWRYRRRGWLYIGSGWSGTDGITFTFSGTDPVEWVWIVDEATGLNTTTPYAGLGADFISENAVTGHSVTDTATSGTGDATYSCIQLENNQTSLAAASFTALGESAAGTTGVRRSETGWNSSGLETAAWTWGGSSQGVGAVIIILSAATSGSGLITYSEAARHLVIS